MAQKSKLLLAGISLIVLLLGASILYNRLAGGVNPDNLASANNVSDNSQQEQPKQFPPDFTVMDASGNEVKLSDFRGKPTVVNFWASWCVPCQSEMPDFNAVYQRMGDDIHFLMVNMTDGGQESLESAQKFVADSGYTFPVYYDTQYSAAMAYGVSSLPTTYFFDAEGYGVAYAIGAINEEALLRGINMINGE
jgi:thiol-disulfide isomerase/thioredoxin